MNVRYDCYPGINNYPKFQEDGFTDVSVLFNDPEGDCISDDFTITFSDPYGNTETWTNENGNNGDPIGFDNQGCCPVDFISGGGGQDLGCGCEWEVTSDGIIITCPCIAQ